MDMTAPRWRQIAEAMDLERCSMWASVTCLVRNRTTAEEGRQLVSQLLPDGFDAAELIQRLKSGEPIEDAGTLLIQLCTTLGARFALEYESSMVRTDAGTN